MKNIIIPSNFTISNTQETTNRLEIEGYACHFNTTNLNHERVDEKSFTKFLGMFNNGEIIPKLNYNHTTEYIGGITNFNTDNTGLKIRAYLNKEVAIVRDMLLPNILDGNINQFSTEGFVENGYNGIVEFDDGSYYVKDFILTDVAIVAHPADPKATFTLANFIEEYKVQKLQNQRKILMLL